MIAAKVANALALDYPRERLQVIVASDGSADATAERARAAGADLVLELPARRQGRRPERRRRARHRRAGRLPDANSAWAQDALARLVAPFADPGVGYVCGQVRFADPGAATTRAPTGATRWRCGRWSRRSAASLPATAPSTRSAARHTCRSPRRAATISPSLRAGEARAALARRARRARRGEDGAHSRGRVRPKRRMMRALGHRRRRRWSRPAATRRCSPGASSSRLLRYLSPLLHLLVLAANVALLGQGSVYTATLARRAGAAGDGAAGSAAAAGAAAGRRPLRDDDRLDRRRPLGPLAQRAPRASWEKARGSRMTRVASRLVLGR